MPSSRRHRVVEVARWHSFNEPLQPLARFHLDGDKLTTEWLDDNYQREVEVTGIMLMARTLRPADGRAFVDALPAAYCNSSRIVINEITATTPAPTQAGEYPDRGSFLEPSDRESCEPRKSVLLASQRGAVRRDPAPTSTRRVRNT